MTQIINFIFNSMGEYIKLIMSFEFELFGHSVNIISILLALFIGILIIRFFTFDGNSFSFLSFSNNENRKDKRREYVPKHAKKQYVPRHEKKSMFDKFFKK